MRKYINKQTDTSLSNVTDWRDFFLVGSTLAIIVAFLSIGQALLNKDEPVIDTGKAEILAAIAELEKTQASHALRIEQTVVNNTVAASNTVLDKIDIEGDERSKEIAGIKKAILTSYKSHRHEKFVSIKTSDDKNPKADKPEKVAVKPDRNRRKLTLSKPESVCGKGQHHIPNSDYCVDDKQGHVIGTEPFTTPAKVEGTPTPMLDYDPNNNKVVEVK